MKFRLNGKEINLNRVRRIRRIGHRVAEIGFHTGEAIRVTCGVSGPDRGIISYHGSFEELKAIVDTFIYRKPESDDSTAEEV